MNNPASQVIAALGGTAAVARMFKVSMPSVSDWKKDGIPSARMMFLRAVKRQELGGLDLEAATSTRRRVLAPKQASFFEEGAHV